MAMMETDVTSEKNGGKVMQKIENWSRIRRLGFFPSTSLTVMTLSRSCNLLTYQPAFLQPSALLTETL